MTNQLALQQLEAHLWEAANILRGPVDAADFKSYVFPLLFFKRISDVHDEEYETALAESAADEECALFPQNYRFQVPADCHWRDVRGVTSNVGQAVQKAMRASKKPIPKLFMAFSAMPSGQIRIAFQTHSCATLLNFSRASLSATKQQRPTFSANPTNTSSKNLRILQTRRQANFTPRARS
jgi:type I restriction-modification system DNA methylase subunit